MDGPDFGRIQQSLAEFQDLGLSGPSLLSSQVLYKALAPALRDCRAVLPFCRHFEAIHGFRPEDLEAGETKDGHRLPSLAERFRTFVARESSAADSGDLMDWAWGRTEAWKDECPKEQWVVYHYAKGLLRRGRREDAAPYIGRAVARNLNQGWAWMLVADLLPEHPDEAFIVRAYAISIVPKAEFWGDAAVQIIPDLINRRRVQEAAWVARSYETAFTDQNWPVRPPMRDFLDEPWSRGDQKPLDPNEFRASAQTILALACAYEVLEAVVDHQNREKRLAWVLANDVGFPLSHRMPGASHLQRGDEIRIFRCENRPVFFHCVRAAKNSK